MKKLSLGITTAHTILKNEIKFLDKWFEYTKDLDYRVLLDTGSTDGSWEYLQEKQKKDSGLIIEQKIFTPWLFYVARNYNLNMIPKETNWVFSPDLDEYFSRNTLDELEALTQNKPELTNMSCARLDIYSEEVFVGQPKHIGSNKIFRFGDYRWKGRIYEHLTWIHKDRYECEIYNPNVFLIHDQDYKKEDRADQYLSLLMDVWKDGYEGHEEDYDWCMWFLVNHFFKEQNMEMFIKTACDYIPYAQEEEKKKTVIDTLNKFLMLSPDELTDDLKKLILNNL